MNDNDGIQVIPFYFLADVSYSMEGDPIKSLNDLLPTVKDAMQANPAVADMIRFALLSFSDDVQVELPLSDLNHVHANQIPELTLRGGTNFASALTKLKSEIQADYTRLRNDGFKVKRSIALLLSDGEPNEPEDSWQKAFEDLTSMPQFPNLVPIGIGNANREVLKKLRHRKDGPAPAPALFLNDGTNIAGMISELIQALTKSMVASAVVISSNTAPSGGHAQVVFEGLTNAPGWDAELD
jgi:uncharacterized protein YegL